MPTLLERIAARIGWYHGRSVYARLMRRLQDARRVQERVLIDLLQRNAESEYGRRHDFARIRTIDDFRRAAPLVRYEELRPSIERVMNGETTALFSPREAIRMFATTSGTTSRTKYIPVTAEFERQYRRGWNAFGLKMLTDHPASILRAILQSSGRFDERRTAAGVPVGAITGLLARTQKRIVKRFYVGRPEISHIGDVRGRHYALMRLALGRDVAFAITANPATLIQLAKTADAERERLIRDVRDGTMNAEIVGDARIRALLASGLRPSAARAAELEEIRRRTGALLPRDYWRLSFLACWTGGSMGHYLGRVRELYGALPIRDIGLLASEGRVTLPLEDDTPAGVLDVEGAFFEFVPIEDVEAANPATCCAWELEAGRDYAVVLTNAAGLTRYRLDDVVRVRGRLGEAPLLEFLYRAGGVASIAGEKLTENQFVEALRGVCGELGLPALDAVAAPCWGEPPYYRVSVEMAAPAAGGDADSVREEFTRSIDAALRARNEEYASRRSSMRLGPPELRVLPTGTIGRMDARLLRSRGGMAEQYKRPCLFIRPGADDEALEIGQAARA